MKIEELLKSIDRLTKLVRIKDQETRDESGSQEKVDPDKSSADRATTTALKRQLKGKVVEKVSEADPTSCMPKRNPRKPIEKPAAVLASRGLGRPLQKQVDIPALADKLYELIAPRLSLLLETSLAPLLKSVADLSARLSSIFPPQSIPSFGCLDPALFESRQGEMPHEDVRLPTAISSVPAAAAVSSPQAPVSTPPQTSRISSLYPLLHLLEGRLILMQGEMKQMQEISFMDVQALQERVHYLEKDNRNYREICVPWPRA
ncbi:hypothetical protein KSP40_PGU002995 [Platanthera guangdongensis]|uniref:Uncharacterized protein n=1 Tax=Platanthera guangdongensis TaxID=2320717 RepID=A0ABR2N011_9ASPA